VIDLDDDMGWLVTGHHPHMFTFVLPSEVSTPNDLMIGLYGRSKRGSDGDNPVIVHVEDRRAGPTE
jgi:hypothetical protein